MRSRDIDDIVKTVGRRVAELRSQAQLTQEELAERLGFSVKYVQRIEGGRENLTLKSLAKIAGELGADATDLFSLPRTKKPGPGRPKGRGGAQSLRR